MASPPSLTEWGGKYVGAVVRIAGLLHLGEHGEKLGRNYPVQPETIMAAERIGQYFKAVAINVFATMNGDPATADAMYLLERIDRRVQDAGKPVEVSARGLFTDSSRSPVPQYGGHGSGADQAHRPRLPHPDGGPESDRRTTLRRRDSEPLTLPQKPRKPQKVVHEADFCGFCGFCGS